MPCPVTPWRARLLSVSASLEVHDGGGGGLVLCPEKATMVSVEVSMSVHAVALGVTALMAGYALTRVTASGVHEDGVLGAQPFLAALIVRWTAVSQALYFLVAFVADMMGRRGYALALRDSFFGVWSGPAAVATLILVFSQNLAIQATARSDELADVTAAWLINRSAPIYTALFLGEIFVAARASWNVGEDVLNTAITATLLSYWLKNFASVPKDTPSANAICGGYFIASVILSLAVRQCATVPKPLVLCLVNPGLNAHVVRRVSYFTTQASPTAPTVAVKKAAEVTESAVDKARELLAQHKSEREAMEASATGGIFSEDEGEEAGDEATPAPKTTKSRRPPAANVANGLMSDDDNEDDQSDEEELLSPDQSQIPKELRFQNPGRKSPVRDLPTTRTRRHKPINYKE
ncbi:uncharacterized protein MONBRDRAFT_33678 [Monosiga brevicollis MX1]|uniref:Uncharacterized protein n=1 Tax=Monosiga brevicollis TaxID=81824 RepID=A9V6I8_MONBE|nr:uncharacterized protein MONBRDRAFT_33678 [Monosiga brevicollis MX1]EDQ86892.1 predicted protein [Monosiga brevicollis MX1]|eukprot:XP_001748437.1 hypothetical protein [Monosiga brevicollis MX1]